MAIVSLEISNVSEASEVRWQKVPDDIQQKIKDMLGVKQLTDVRSFTLCYPGISKPVTGYTLAILFAERLSFVVLINVEGNFARFTMQRIQHNTPFIRLI